MGRTRIEWARHVWNPGLYGCKPVSPACEHCYAAPMAHRLVGMGRYPEGITKRGPDGVGWTGVVMRSLTIQGLDSLPKTDRGGRKRVFVTSMSDVFHPNVPLDHSGHSWTLMDLFREMRARPHVDFLVLTKRPERAREFAQVASRYHVSTAVYPPQTERWTWPANVWIGCTVEDQRRADERIPHLLQIPARVRFLSCEPLLGPVNLGDWLDVLDHCGACGQEIEGATCDRCPECGAECALTRTWGTAQADRWRTGERYAEDGRHDDLSGPALHWVITGGESGHHARPSNPQWFRDLRDQCAAAGVPFFFKQWGAWVGEEDCDEAPSGYHEQSPEDGGRPRHEWPGRLIAERLRERAGRDRFPGETSYRFGRDFDPKTLDEQTHNEVPRG